MLYIQISPKSVDGFIQLSQNSYEEDMIDVLLAGEGAVEQHACISYEELFNVLLPIVKDKE